MHGDVVPWDVLYEGCQLNGTQIRLIHRGQGIWKPAFLDVALSVLTAAGSPYADAFDSDGLLEYRYATGSGASWQNSALRNALEHGLPVLHLQGVGGARYVPTWPAYVVSDDPGKGIFRIAIDDLRRVDESVPDELAESARRAYYTVLARRRLHQAAFRHRVLEAYRSACAVCNLDEEVLLEAAHIVPDSHELGEPLVSNGLALCAIHHVAFDRYLLGVRPDGVIRISSRLRDRSDGPMLLHGLQAFHGRQLAIPEREGDRPEERLLQIRYDAFSAAA